MYKPKPAHISLSLEIKDMVRNNPASIVEQVSQVHQLGWAVLGEFAYGLVLVLNEMYKEKRDSEWYKVTSTGLFWQLLDICSEEIAEKSATYDIEEFNVLAVSRRPRWLGHDCKPITFLRAP